MSANDVIRLAQKHIGKGQMVSSAQLCLDDAKNLLNKGDINFAIVRAIKSIAYSVGMSHIDYQKAITAL